MITVCENIIAFTIFIGYRIIERFVENPYWQYFCGFEYFQHTFPLDPTSLVRWRKRIKPEGMEKLLQETIATAQRGDLLRKSDVARVNADTTVQEKAIAFPTDARLYHKMRKAPVTSTRFIAPLPGSELIQHTPDRAKFRQEGVRDRDIPILYTFLSTTHSTSIFSDSPSAI